MDGKTSPNQRTILIKRDMPSNRCKKPYICAYRDRIAEAAKNLTPVGFKLYLYLISNQDNYNFAFSTSHFAEEFGCDVKSAKAAANQLIEKNYLTLAPGCKNKFIFNETPQAAPIALPSSLAKKLIKKEFIDYDTNTSYSWTYEELLNIGCSGDEELAKKLWEDAK